MDINILDEVPQLITHAIGFLITLWVPKEFAWAPLLNLMEERRNRIKSEFENIEAERARADALLAEYEAKLREIDAERRAKLVEAVDEGRKIAEEIKAAAHDEAREITVKAKSDLERDVAKARVTLQGDMVALTLAATEKLIRQKMDDAKHRELISSFIDNLEKA